MLLLVGCNVTAPLKFVSATCFCFLRQVGALCEDMGAVGTSSVWVNSIRSAYEVWRSLGYPTPGLLGFISLGAAQLRCHTFESEY